ncbi:MAG: NYN domain-containing protein [Planctomycetes bacterium]|nr:NYN domain-containing protein [Planctomycetota bacterium]
MSDHWLATVFVDYDNLHPRQKEAGVLDVLTKTLVQVPWDTSETRGRCEVRVYGGWYEGESITRMAEDLTVELQKDFPVIVRIPLTNGATLAMHTNAELAVSLLQEPGHHLFNTFRRKGKPPDIRVEEPATVGCTDAACLLPQVKTLLKSGKCPKAGCTVATCELLYRHEQKIVDTMLTCDLIHASALPTGWIILISGDDDFLPPLRTILLRDRAVVRCYPKPNNRRARFPHGGATLYEVEL